MQERILVFIPAYNCERQIGRVLKQFTPAATNIFTQILIVDNDSRDGTIEAAKQAAAECPLPVTIIKNAENYNLGGSIKSAFLYALEHKFDYVVTIHGDDQANLPDMIKQIRAGNHRHKDFMIGARFHPESKLSGYSLVRTWGNHVLNQLCGFVTHRKIYDMIAGLNCYRVEYLRSLFFLNFPNDLTFDAHFLLYGIHTNARFSYFPMLWREEDQISNAKVVQQALTILFLFARKLFMPGDRLFAVNRSGHDITFRYPGTVVYST